MRKTIIPGDSKNRCFICGRYGQMQCHHVLHGSRRKQADRYGLTVHLCVNCHTILHDKGLHDRELEALGQEAFESIYGHELYMRVFGKDYRV